MLLYILLYIWLRVIQLLLSIWKLWVRRSLEVSKTTVYSFHVTCDENDPESESPPRCWTNLQSWIDWGGNLVVCTTIMTTKVIDRIDNHHAVAYGNRNLLLVLQWLCGIQSMRLNRKFVSQLERQGRVIVVERTRENGLRHIDESGPRWWMVCIVQN